MEYDLKLAFVAAVAVMVVIMSFGLVSVTM